MDSLNNVEGASALCGFNPSDILRDETLFEHDEVQKTLGPILSLKRKVNKKQVACHQLIRVYQETANP